MINKNPKSLPRRQAGEIRNPKISTSSSETKKIGFKIAHTLRGGEVILLIGDLGSGKTTFTKGLAQALGVKSPITSPTFVLMKHYKTTQGKIKQLVHLDCYRVKGFDLLTAGLDDYLGAPDSVTVIEWGEKLPKLPAELKIIKIKFSHRQNPSERIVTM